jgi:hypothetical protein
MRNIRVAAFLLVVSSTVPALAQTAPPIPPTEAAKVFNEAHQICSRDGGRLWGHSLCGPMLLVEPMHRTVVANQADLRGALTATGPVFTGVLPPAENMANTAVPWSGVFWTEIIWPLPSDEVSRHVLIAHELYHRIQPALAIPRPKGGDNAHLDTREGRYLTLLEWCALAKALQAGRAGDRRAAVDDALAFRAERYRLFPEAAESERALELNEGLAEYTGVRLGVLDPGAERAFAVADLKRHAGDATLVRSFAYGSGPAYGLLLDRYAPGWRRRMKSGPRLDALLKAALPADRSHETVEARAARYDGAALRTAEVERDRTRQILLAELRRRFVEGPVLSIPTPHINYQFNPTALQPLDNLGTVFPNIRVTDAFGVLEASHGALLSKTFDQVVVSAAGADVKALKGDGWTLTLKPGWVVKPGARPGDFTVAPTP